MAPHLARTLPGGSGLRPEVPVPQSTDRLLPGFVETFCGAGLRPGPAIRTRRRGTIRRFLRLSSHLGGLTLIPTGEALSAEFCRIRASRSVDARVTSFGRRNGGWIAQ